MSAIAVESEAPIPAAAAVEPIQTTLLELVRAVSQVTDDEREIVATVLELLYSGRARLIGSFRDVPVDVFLGSETRSDA